MLLAIRRRRGCGTRAPYALSGLRIRARHDPFVRPRACVFRSGVRRIDLLYFQFASRCLIPAKPLKPPGRYGLWDDQKAFKQKKEDYEAGASYHTIRPPLPATTSHHWHHNFLLQPSKVCSATRLQALSLIAGGLYSL